MAHAPSRHRVVALVYDGVGTFEFGIVSEVFGLRRPGLAANWYDFRMCSLEGTPAKATGGARIAVPHGIGAFRTAGTIVIPGWRDPDEIPPAFLLRALHRAHQRGARLISICSGAFVLAAAGVLDGRRATTHWRRAELLRQRYPRIRVEPDVLYVDEGNVLTSAGSAAGIDLCLHVVRCDYGAEVANHVARHMLVPPHRDGGQSQFVRQPVPSHSRAGLSTLLDWALERLDRPLPAGELARQAGMSVRTLARRFTDEMGTTPHRWLTHQRLLAAQRRLETTDDSVDAVAEAAGFESAMTLRHHFRRAFRTTPTAYRRRFTLGRRKRAARRGSRAAR